MTSLILCTLLIMNRGVGKLMDQWVNIWVSLRAISSGEQKKNYDIIR